MSHLTGDEQADREALLAGRRRVGPAGRYYPVYVPPVLPDGTLDVAAWCADLDAWFNAGLT